VINRGRRGVERAPTNDGSGGSRNVGSRTKDQVTSRIAVLQPPRQGSDQPMQAVLGGIHGDSASGSRYCRPSRAVMAAPTCPVHNRREAETEWGSVRNPGTILWSRSLQWKLNGCESNIRWALSCQRGLSDLPVPLQTRLPDSLPQPGARASRSRSDRRTPSSYDSLFTAVYGYPA